VPIADELFEGHPAGAQGFNQKKNLAVDSLQIQRTAKISTTDDCSEAQPAPTTYRAILRRLGSARA